MKHQSVSTAGSTVFWSIPQQEIQYADLVTEWNKRSLPEDLLPAPPRPQKALSRAVGKQRIGKGDHRQIPSRLKETSSWALVAQDVVGDDDLRHATEAKARLVRDEHGKLSQLETEGNGLASKIADEFKEQLGTYNNVDASTFLKHTAERLRGVSMRDNGGLFFLPETVMPTFQQYASLIEALFKDAKVVALEPVVTANTIAAAIDALKAEVDKKLEALNAEVDATLSDPEADDAIGIRAIRNRIGGVAEMASKIKEYEGLFSTKLDDLNERADTARMRLFEAEARLEALKSKDTAPEQLPLV